MREGIIKDLCIVIAGQSPEGIFYNTDGEGVEFHQGKKSFGDVLLQPSNVWTTKLTKLAEPLDILMSVRAPVGPTNITDRQVCIGRGLAAIRCKNNALNKYVYYALKNIETKITGNDGAVFNSINKKQIEELPVRIASLSEQQRIVEQLDAEFAKIDAIKQNAEKQLQWAKDLFQSALKDLLTPKEGWEEKKFGSIYDVRDGTHDSPRYIEKGYPLVTSKNLKNGNIDFTKINYISEFDYKKINERSKVDVGDVLLAMIGTIGNPVLVVDEPFYAIKNIALFKVPKNQSGKYLKYLLSSQFILDKFYSESNGANQKFVGLGYLRNFKFPIPSFEEQQIIAEKLDLLSEKVKELQSNYEQMVVLCNDLKQSLLKDIFG
jgi:restriction endonuclease S subunit